MSQILDSINGPQDVKKLKLNELPTLAEEIREKLISTLSQTGGHLGPNLGVVELSIALHRVFNTPDDHFIFDVSHQAYVHKLLTGRRERFHTIRQPGGLNGFMVRSESPHDCFGAGHAGTALSAALGMATARDIRGGDEHVIALAGDAAFTCGVTYEALNNISTHTKRLIVILNDNEWSIDKNVGAIANYLNKIVTSPSYSHLHDYAGTILEKLAGKQVLNLARRAEEAVKGMVLPSVIFEDLGLEYFGPIDGHNIHNLVNTLEFLKTVDHPVLLHVLTKKGKGYQPAQDKQKKFHGTAPFDMETGETEPSSLPTYSQLFADTLVQIANEQSNVVAITGAMPNGTGLDRFQAHHPDRYFDVGIAEEHAVVYAAGLATKGIKPFCAIYSTFLQRAFDPIVHDVCLQNLPVVFCMDRGGLSGDDGPTHHGLFDISYLRCIPNIVHMSPKNEDEFVDMLWTAAHYHGPIAIRYPRGIGEGTKPKEKHQTLAIGKAEILEEGNDISIWSYGSICPLARETAHKLREQGYSVNLVNARFTKPLDRDCLKQTASSAKLVFTFEDHALSGGFGSAVLEELQSIGVQTPLIRIGWPDNFIEHGKPEKLREKYGISCAAALEKARPYLDSIRK